MTYGECFGTGIGESGKIITADTVLEVAAIDESINGDGGLTLGWNSTTGGGLAVGTTIGKYVLMQPYVPTKNSDGSYRYEVKLSDPIALLGKKLFYKMVTVLDRKAGTTSQTPLYTFSFVGKASTIIEALAQAGGVSCDASNLADGGTISVSFDGDSIKSAAEKIGSACDLAVWYTDGCIHFGSSVNFISGEYYNHFVVLGGTKNMTKKIVTSEGEEYAAVTQRLTLDPTQYPGSVIGSGSPEMTKLLVFDNIYPKARLKVTHVYRRECWLLNEAGDRIPTAWQGEGENRVATAWAKYTKWYVRLGDADGEGHIDQSNLERLIVDGTTLRMQFLPFAEGGTSVLAGREFELVHFNGSDPVKEKEDDDVDPNGFMAQPGMYRIVMTADCNTLLPSDALPPAVGDLVTLVNIAVPDTCYAKAREELLSAGQAVATMYGVTVPAPESYTGDGGASIGETSGGYLVTNVHTDLITGEVQVTYGTLAQRGMIASLIDKVDGVQTAGGGGTTGTSDSQGVGTMSSEQWNALAQAGGRTGLVTINNRIDRVANQVQTYGTDLAQVQSQADQKMQMWFGTYAPTAANYPAVEWVTDAEKQLHVEDIFYNYSREAADPDGGKVWRWTRHEETVNGETVVTYSWDEVTDAETLLAIEKASDIASDGKITGGAEKVRLYNEWLRVVDEYAKYNALRTYGLNVTRYNTAYSMLAQTLNGGEPFTSGTPSWVASLSSTTNILFDDEFLELAAFQYLGLHIELTDVAAASREVYRNVWAKYYEEADALDRASKVTANDAFQNVTKLADDGIISAGSEKSQLLTLWRETVAEFWKYLEQAEDYDLQKERVNPNTDLNTYRSYVLAYVRVAEMLNNDEQGTIDYTDYINSATYKFTDNIPDLLTGTSLPLWLGSDVTSGFGKDTRLSQTETGTAATYRAKWQDYYTARAILLKAIEAKAKGATDMAQTTADTAQTMAQTVMDTISAAVYDNLLDEDDLETLNDEFEALIYDADSVLERTYTPLGVSLSGVGQLRSQLITAIQVIGTLLNIDPESPESNHDWTFIYNDVSRSVTVNGITTTVFFPEIDKEDTLGANIPYLLDETFEYSEPIAISGTAFLDAWSDYYSIRADLLTAIAKVAERGVYDASDLLSGIADDKRIMQNEKNDLLKQWQAWASEYAVLMAAKNDSTINAGAKWDVYETKLYRLAHFLKDLTDSTTAITVATFEPTMLMTQGITVLTVAQATLYKTVLREFRTARTDLLTALSTGKMNYWVSPFLPVSDFYIGDRCVWKNHLADGTYESGTDTTMICVKQHDENYVYRQQTWNNETSEYKDSETADADTENGSNWFDYWKEASTVIGETERDPRQQLAALADRLYTLYGSDAAHFPIAIQLTDNGNTVTLNSGSYASDDDVGSCLEQIKGIIGNVSFSIYLSAELSHVRYDMLCVPVTCSIPGSNGETVTGGIQIKMYNGTEWEYIQESTSSLLESLGNKILAMVFGSNAAATEAAGLTVGQRFAKLFAQATVWDETANDGQGDYVTLSQALFGLSISQDINGRYYSSAQLCADKIDFTTSSFNIDASHITFASGNSTLNLGNDIITLLVNSFGSGDEETLSATIGMVVRSDSGNAFSFGTYDAQGNWQNGLEFTVETSGNQTLTKLNLNANNVNIASGLFELIGSSVNVRADHITFVGDNGSTLKFSANNIDFTGYIFQVNASNINFDTSIGAGNIDFTTGSFHIDASHIVITDNGTEVAIIENGKIRASLIDVTNLNVLGALTGQTIDMQNATFQNLHVSGEVTGILTAKQLYKAVKQIVPSVYDNSNNLRTRCTDSADGYGLIRMYSAEALLADCDNELPSLLVIRDMSDSMNEVPSAGITESSLMGGSYQMRVELPAASTCQGMEILVVLQGRIYYESGALKHFYRSFHLYSYNEEGFAMIMGGHNENSLTYFYPTGSYEEKNNYATRPTWSVRLISAYMEEYHKWKWLILENNGCSGSSWAI